jgi:hypothetical protein
MHDYVFVVFISCFMFIRWNECIMFEVETIYHKAW